MSLLPKSEQDCVFFLQGICSKTDCEYRHCEPCLTNLNVCPDWQNGKPCSRPNCSERHSNKHLAGLQGFNKSSPNPETPCKYNLNCQRPDCIFKHTGPRYIDTQQQRSFFPRPMSMTFRPRPQAAGGVESIAQPGAIGLQQPQVVPIQQSVPQAVRPVYNRPNMQRPQARPNQFIPQANNNNQNAPAKGQLQIAGLSSRQNQNTNIRPVQQQTQAQNVRPTNKLRPMSERLSLPNGNNNNARNGAQNGNAKVNLQSKAGPPKAEKPLVRQAPVTNAKVRGVVQLEKPRTSAGPSFGDPLTIEQIRAMKANKAKAAGQASATSAPQASAPATNIQKPAPKVAATKPVPVQNVKATIPPKRTIEDTVKEETQATNDTTNIDDLGYGDYSQFDAELLDLEKPAEPVPEPKKAKVEPTPVNNTTVSHTVSASDPKKNKLDDATVPEAKKTKIDSVPAQPQPTTTESNQTEDLDNLGDDYDLGASGIDLDFLAELENY